jgi:phage I-like protein
VTTEATGAGLAVSLNAEGAAPDWVQLLPDGPVIRGRDGRTWTAPDLALVINRFREARADLPVDLEHATQLKGARGEPAPAVGWIKDLEARGQALWAKVEWTADGAAAVATRAYRYLSPVFDFDRATTAVHRIRSAGLTNLPNLELAALNRAAEPETPMDVPAPIRQALGLPDTATPEAAVAAITALTGARDTALNRVTALEASGAAPDPARFVPRADYDLAMNRLTTLETAAAAARDAAVTAAVDAAIAAGKVAPASRDYHVAACRQEGGLARFEAMVGAVPAIVSPATGAAAGTPPGTTATALNAEEQAVAAKLGLSHEEFAKAKELAR